MTTLFEIPTTLVFRSMEDIKAAITEIKKEETTFERLKELQNYFIENEEKTAAEIVSKLTIKQINTFIYSRPGNNKSELVKAMTKAISQSFDICEGMLSYSWTFGEEKKADPERDALKKRFDSTTPEMYQVWKDKRAAKVAAFKKAMENPETLQEFKTFIERKGEAALTTDQRILYNTLRADTIRDHKDKEEERRNEVAAVELEGVGMTIKTSTHTKKNIPLWVVVLSERVDKDKYNELNTRAKKLGGYYSSYNKGGAIPGFTFEDEQAAKMFCNLKDESQNNTEAINEVKTQTRAEVLREKGTKLIETGEEELNKDRQANTARRARFAASAENAATAKIETGKTFLKIAEGLEAGNIKYLDRLNNLTEIETLESVLSVAKWKHIREKGLKSDQYELNEETIFYVEIPFPTLYGKYCNCESFLETPGKKLAAARMLKRLKGVDFISIDTPQRFEDYKTLFCIPSGTFSKWEAEKYIKAAQTLNRIKKLRLDTIYELRAAILELINLKKGATITPEQKRALKIKELERSFINKKIDGFFPTPANLTREKLRLLNIQPGDKIAEPSAGLGHMAEIVADRFPDNHLQCIEYYQPLAEALELKGFDVLCEDFLTHTGKYDKIIMNPPFENLQDIDHVLKAWECLNEGGRIVATMANNKQGDRKKIVDFMAFVDQHGYYTENPAGSFESAFRPTGVNTITVVLDK